MFKQEPRSFQPNIWIASKKKDPSIENLRNCDHESRIKCNDSLLFTIQFRFLSFLKEILELKEFDTIKDKKLISWLKADPKIQESRSSQNCCQNQKL